MRKGSVIFLLSVMMLFTILVGCSGNNSGSGGNAAANEGEGGTANSGAATKLSLWTFSELHINFYKEMERQWNEKNPDKQVTLELTTLPYEDMHNKLLLALQSGTGAPDLADVEISKFGNFLKGQPQLVELNDVVEPELGNVVKSRFDIYSKDGKYYGIDFHVGATVMYYNKGILDQAGVDPDSIVTWDDYLEAGKKVVAATGKPMTTLETSDHWFLWPAINQQGSDYLDENGNVILDNEINVNTLKFAQKLLDEKVAVIAPGGDHAAEEYFGFMDNGGAASVMMPYWYMVRLTDYMPSLKGNIIIKPMPAWTDGGFRSAGMGGTGTVVTNQVKVPELAKQFLAFAKMSKEGSIQTWKILGFDPLRTDVWDLPEMKEANKFTEYFGTNIFDTLIEVKDEINPVHITEDIPAIVDKIKSDVLPRVLEGKEDPAKVLKEAADQFRN
ncbi:ABC transporter substrate-binding protein [Paenibacillus abyssi]|uniref:Arabinose-binding protein n=1 Tax=Paenibacillus abyssi TaxID=1340531 RepID=A0A917CNU4_9BACL|nr:ABC transporter substrate-binding protein [Paenibacillus abyssi]GGF93873.1 putative arabinose-binding protein [Paenibacillus abyssi]